MNAVAVIGTDTGVGKTRIARLLVQGFRLLGERVWIHKPVACGGFDGIQSDDGRALAAVCGDGQDPGTVCPWNLREPASPHLAAAAEGVELTVAGMAGAISALRGPHHLVVEGVGGLLVPLTASRQTVLDLLVAARLPALVVTRPHLGTLNHTALTVLAARSRGVPLIGLVINAAQPCPPSLASDQAGQELSAITGLPVLLDVGFDPRESTTAQDLGSAAARAQAAIRLATAVRAWQHNAGREAGT